MRNLFSSLTTFATVSAVTVAMSLTVTAPAQALTANVQQASDHYVSCFKLMLTDSDAHAAQCSPSRIPESLQSLSTPVSYTAPVKEECSWDYKGGKEFKGGKGSKDGKGGKGGPKKSGGRR